MRIALRWIGIILLSLFLIGFAVIFFMPSDWLRNRVNAQGSAVLGREFAIDGDIDVDWDWTIPEVFIHKVRIANAPKSKDPDMLAIDQVDFKIKIWRLLLAELNLPKLNFTKPKVILEKFSPTKKNLDFPRIKRQKIVRASRS